MGKRLGGAGPKSRQRTVDEMTPPGPPALSESPAVTAYDDGHRYAPTYLPHLDATFPACTLCGHVYQAHAYNEDCPGPPARILGTIQPVRGEQHDDCPF